MAHRKLTPQQKRILLLLICRLSEAQVADRLDLTVSKISRERGRVNKMMGSNDLTFTTIMALLQQEITLKDIAKAFIAENLPIPKRWIKRSRPDSQ